MKYTLILLLLPFCSMGQSKDATLKIINKTPFNVWISPMWEEDTLLSVKGNDSSVCLKMNKWAGHPLDIHLERTVFNALFNEFISVNKGEDYIYTITWRDEKVFTRLVNRN